LDVCHFLSLTFPFPLLVHPYIAAISFIAGLISLSNFIYFASDEYSGSQTNIPLLLQGSAMCTDTSWVPCVTVHHENDGVQIVSNSTRSCGDIDGFRIARGTNIDPDTNVDEAFEATFALRNNCEGATARLALVNLASLVFVVVGIVGMNFYLNRHQVMFDEDEQTAQDYSVIVNNPPGDATDPEEWRNYFKDAFEAEVTICTVAVNNDLLVRTLVERRERLRQITRLVEPGTSLDTLTLARLAAQEERKRRCGGYLWAYFSPGIPELLARLVWLTTKVQGLAQQDYPAKHIFVTFERETDQRNVLWALNYGQRDRRKGRLSAAKDAKHLFRGKHLISVLEAEEPNTIRWQDLNERWIDRFKQQLATTLASFSAIILIAFTISRVNKVDVTLSASVIALFNISYPSFAKFLTSFESHVTEGRVQRSIYLKSKCLLALCFSVSQVVGCMC
jgi:hypothetical protein